MSLVTDIQSIITALYPDATQVLSSKFQAFVTSFELETTELPLFIIDNELSKEPEIKQNNNVIKDSKILVSILMLDSTEYTDEQSELLRAATEEMADKLAVNIYQKLPVRPNGNQKYRTTPMFHVSSQNFTGTALDMRVLYNEVVSFVTTAPIPD